MLSILSVAGLYMLSHKYKVISNQVSLVPVLLCAGELIEEVYEAFVVSLAIGGVCVCMRACVCVCVVVYDIFFDSCSSLLVFKSGTEEGSPFRVFLRDQLPLRFHTGLHNKQ